MELIKINQDESGNQTVSAKDLHVFLEVKTEFSNWIKRMLEYGFQTGVDFTPFLTESNGGRPGTDYALTLDTAKEISMIQRTEKGKQARQYFIECEKVVKSFKPLTQLEIIAQSAQILVGLEKRQSVIEEKVYRLEAQNVQTPEYFTIAGYGSYHKLNLNLKECQAIGRKATIICKVMGWQVESVRDPRFGRVNTYPVEALKQAFEETGLKVR